jgi:hypothetical protein
MYRIRVQGNLSANWGDWFSGFTLSSDPGGVTTLSGPVRDQAELHGLLARVRDLNLILLAVEVLEPEPHL